jgi:ABC-type multidrug transport system fused ATPase/permease subunit
VFFLNKPEWPLIIIGCISCTITGGIQPAFSVIFSRVINVFSKCDRNEQEKDINMYCLLFASIGIIAFFSNLIQCYMFGLSGENLTKRIRSIAFKAILSQEVGWFDKPENNVGTLTTRLATEAAAVQGATGSRLGGVLMNVANLGVGIVLAFIYGWAITLVVLGFIPFIIISGVLQTKMMAGFSGKDKDAIEEAGKFTGEAISNIRTVAVLNKESYFAKLYSDKIDAPYKYNSLF